MVEEQKNKKLLWGVRLLVLVITIIALGAIGAWVIGNNKKTEERLGGPMYGIDIVATGEDKFIIDGKKSVLIYENDGTDYEIDKYLIDLKEKKIWKLADRFNKDGDLLTGNTYLSEREVAEEDVDDLHNLYNDIIKNRDSLGKKDAEGINPYVLETGGQNILIFDENVINRILEAMGL